MERPPDHKTEASGEAGSLWLQARCLIHQVWDVGRHLSDLASVISLTKDLKSLGWTGKRRTSMSGNRCRSEKERATEMETERTH